MKRALLRWLSAGALALTTACSRSTPKSAGASGVHRCRYDVDVTSEHPLVLDVTAACSGGSVNGLAASGAETLAGLSEVTSTAGPLARAGRLFKLGRSVEAATFRYRIDLDAIAARSDTVDVALRSGEALIAASSTFLLHPLPLDTGTEVELGVRTPPGVRFASGLERRGDHFRLQAHEIPVATYSVFGRFVERAIELDRGRARLDLVVLGAGLALSPDTLASWARVRADVIASFYGGFPVRRALVAVVPVPARARVRFGKLLPESAPGIVLLVGAEATEHDLDVDWVLVHELFHIGVPSFYREGKWFDEGLATYFEPILRARAGLLDEGLAWRDLRFGMPRGLSALTELGLENTDSFSGIYWGGAIYCLLADVELRRGSNGRVGLEDGVRGVHRMGGRASDVWPLREVLKVADGVFGRPVLAGLEERYARGPAPVDLAGLFESLGVFVAGDSVELRDDAPLAWVRRAIVAGSPQRTTTPVSPSTRR